MIAFAYLNFRPLTYFFYSEATLQLQLSVRLSICNTFRGNRDFIGPYLRYRFPFSVHSPLIIIHRALLQLGMMSSLLYLFLTHMAGANYEG